jgi:hypothetical protein
MEALYVYSDIKYMQLSIIELGKNNTTNFQVYIKFPKYYQNQTQYFSNFK